MKAGALRERITIERFAGRMANDLGEVAETWSTLRALRAQLVEQIAGETAEASGVAASTSITFRTRYVAGLTVADRVRHADRVLDIVEVRELGRRGGHEIRCTVRGLA